MEHSDRDKKIKLEEIEVSHTKKKKNPWFLGKCLHLFFITPVEGRRDR
jgi:hypothetical protein